MKYSITYEYIKDDTILIRTFKGSLSLNEIANCIKDDIKQGAIHGGLIGVINDYLEADIHIEMDDLDKILSVFEERQDLFLAMKWAVIVDFSVAAVPSIFKEKNPEYSLQSFTDFPSALRWVEGVS